jgi:hypothetical protein
MRSGIASQRGFWEHFYSNDASNCDFGSRVINDDCDSRVRLPRRCGDFTLLRNEESYNASQ